MHDELSEQVELAPDIEWLLLKDEAKAEDLLVQLVEDYGVGLGLLMQTMFVSTSTAQEALEESLVRIVLQSSHYHSDQSIKVWLYSLALDTAWQVRRRWKLGRAIHEERSQAAPMLFMPPNSLPGWLGYLPEQTRLAVTLQRNLGLSQAEIAQVLGVSASSIASDLAVVDEIFPFRRGGYSPRLELDRCDRLVQTTHRRLAARQSRDRLRHTFMEMSWAAGAILLVALLTRIYDLRNPDPARQVVDIPFLTPLPTSVGSPSFTPTAKPLLDENSTSEEIAVRYLLRAHNFTSLWEDALVILGGAQGSPEGYVIKRVEIGWDALSRKMIMLVGPPDGPPENGLFVDGSSYYELTIHDGSLVNISTLDLTLPKAWYYLASLPFNLQAVDFSGNFFEGNVWFRVLGKARAAGRDALLVEIVNSNGITEAFSWLDTATAIPLRQQRSGEQGLREQGLRTSLVLDVIVDQIALDEPFPGDYFRLATSRNIEFRADLNGWRNDPALETSIQRMEQSSVNREFNYPGSSSRIPLYYQVNEMAIPGSMKYSTSVSYGSQFIGEFPMSNPWSVKCERSADGNQVAFIEDRRFEFGVAFPSQVLHWFSLDDPAVLHTPLPDDDVTQIAFSPDGNLLAVHAANGVSIIDLQTNQVTFLLEVRAVDRLAFSKNGIYLGILRNAPRTGRATNVWIIDVTTSEIVGTVQFEPDQDWESYRAGISESRQVDFSGPFFFGLENCR